MLEWLAERLSAGCIPEPRCAVPAAGERHAADHPNLFFDTAWWSVLDHLTLFGLVPPGQILFGSDMPYGTTMIAVSLGLRTALQAGLSFLPMTRHI